MRNNKWFKFLILYLGATVLSLSQLKMVPVFDEISSTMNLTMTQTSILNSIFTFSALFLAIPCGSLLSKFGAKKMSLFVMCCLVAGNLLGAMSKTYTLLLISRVVEGISFSMIMMLGMVYIGYWFKEKGTGMAIGIFGTFSALATVISMPLFGWLYHNYGMSSLWFFMASVSLVAFVLFYLFFDNPDQSKNTNQKEESATLKEVISDRNVCILAMAMGCMTFVLYTYIAIYPKIFVDLYSANTATASSLYGLFGIFGIPFGFIAGLIIDKTKKPAVLGYVTFFVLAIACFMTNLLTLQTLVIQVFVLSACISMSSSSISISIPMIVKRPALIGFSFSVVYLFYYIGTLIGLPIVSFFVEKSGWGAGILLLTVISLVGAVLMVYVNYNTKHLRHATEKSSVKQNA